MGFKSSKWRKRKKNMKNGRTCLLNDLRRIKYKTAHVYTTTNYGDNLKRKTET